MNGPGVAADNWAGRHPRVATLLTAAAALLPAAALLWISLPDVEGLAAGWPERTAYMRLRVEQAAGEGRDLRIDYRPVPLSRIPATVRRAVLVSEDAAFYGHGGFDWHEIEAAFRRAWRERSAARGASTITQQLARNLYLSPNRSLLRKVREALIATKLERALPKARILELYLNVIEFGPGIFGVEAASRRYFGVGVHELGPRRAARLAATIPAPLLHNPATDTGRFRWRSELAFRRAFGPEEEREEIGPPPDSLSIERPPALPAGALPAPDAVEPPPAPDTAAPAPRDTTAPSPPDTMPSPPDTMPSGAGSTAADGGAGRPTPPDPSNA